MAEKRGRPTLYTEELAAEICERLAKGESLRSICRADHMPDERRARDWARNPEHPFSPQYALARDAGLDAMGEEILEISDNEVRDWRSVKDDKGNVTGVQVDGEHIQRSRLRVDTRKWYLSKLAPKRYGDRLAMEHSGPEGGDIPIPGGKTVELAREILALISEAKQNDNGS